MAPAGPAGAGPAARRRRRGRLGLAARLPAADQRRTGPGRSRGAGRSAARCRGHRHPAGRLGGRRLPSPGFRARPGAALANGLPAPAGRRADVGSPGRGHAVDGPLHAHARALSPGGSAAGEPAARDPRGPDRLYGGRQRLPGDPQRPPCPSSSRSCATARSPGGPADSLVWGRIMAMLLSGNWRMELLRAKLLKHLDPATSPFSGLATPATRRPPSPPPRSCHRHRSCGRCSTACRRSCIRSPPPTPGPCPAA